MARCLSLEIPLNHLRSFPEPRGAINRYYFPPDSSFSFLLRSAVLAARDWIMGATGEEKLLLPLSWHSSFHSYAVLGVSLLFLFPIFPPPNLLAPRDFFFYPLVRGGRFIRNPKFPKQFLFPFVFSLPRVQRTPKLFPLQRKWIASAGENFHSN